MTRYESKSKGHKHSDPNMELSIGQVLAAAGATVLGAILAKLLGLWGTLAGTAVLSICSSIGAVLILRAMRRTGEKIKEQITALAPTAKGKATAITLELGPERVTATAKIPDTEKLAALKADTVRLADTDEIVVPAEPVPEGHITESESRNRTLLAIVVSSVLVFGLTVGVLYLLGTFTGDPDRFISNDPQTVVTQTPADDTSTAEDDATTEAPAESESPSESTTTSESPSESPSPSESATSDSPSESPTPDTGTGGSEDTTSPDPQDTITESPTAQ